MRVIGREIGVVHVEFAHGYAVGESGPFAVEAAVIGHAEEAGTAAVGMGVAEGEEASVAHRQPIDRSEGDRGVVNDAIADHLDDIRVGRLVVGSELGQLPSQLLFAWENRTVWVGLDDVILHDLLPWLVELGKSNNRAYRCERTIAREGERMKVLMQMDLAEELIEEIRQVAEEVEVVQVNSDAAALAVMPEIEVVCGNISEKCSPGGKSSSGCRAGSGGGRIIAPRTGRERCSVVQRQGVGGSAFGRTCDGVVAWADAGDSYGGAPAELGSALAYPCRVVGTG